MRFLAVALAAVLLTGCGSRGPDMSGACPHVDESGTIPTCTSLFPGRTGLKLPAGPQDAPVGAVTRGGEFLVDAQGKLFRLKARKVDPTDTDRDTRYATTVYQAKVSNGVATSLRPLLRVSDDAILTHTFGGKTLTGVISSRMTDGSYDVDPKLPIAIRLDANARDKVLHGTIVNAIRTVRVGGGACIVNLPDTSANPLVDGFGRYVTVVRVPSMHVPYDDELVLEWNGSSSGMGSDFYPSVATVMGNDPFARTWQVSQHGTPTSGPSLKLTLTDGPITTC
jgi:hypothetical protein